MPIVTSVIVDQTTQADGSLSVHERHTDHTGLTYDVNYFAPAGMDIDAVLSARASKIGSDIDAREAIEAEANNYTLPIRTDDLMLRLTAAERKAIRQARNTNADVDDVLYVFENRDTINPGSAATQGMFGVLVTAGLLTAERVAELTE